MKGLPRLRSNTAALLISNGLSALLAFVLSALIGRGLGQAGFGVYTAALAWLAPFVLLADFGIGTLITRDVARQPSHAHAYLTQSLRARGWPIILLVTLIYLVAPHINRSHDVALAIRLSLPLLFIGPFFGAFTAILRAQQRMWPIAWLNLGMLSAQVVLTGVALWYGADIFAVVIINTLTSLGQLLAAWGVYRYYPQPTTQVHSISTPPLLRAAAPFALAGLLAAIQTRLPFIALEQLASVNEVALYGAVWRLTEAGRILPNALFGAAFPWLASLALDTKAIQRAHRKLQYALLLYALLAMTTLMLAGTPLVIWSFGPAFADSARLLPPLALGLLPSLLRAGYTLYWYALGRESYANYVTIASVCVQLALTVWMIPQLGGYGAAIAQMLADTFALAILGFAPSKRAPIYTSD